MDADQVIFSDPACRRRSSATRTSAPTSAIRQTGETGAVIQDRAQKGRLTLTITAGAERSVRASGVPRAHAAGNHVVHRLVGGRGPRDRPNRSPTTSRADATVVTSPVTVNGWLGALEDVDVFRVHARAGQDLVAKVDRDAHRLQRRHRRDVPRPRRHDAGDQRRLRPHPRFPGRVPADCGLRRPRARRRRQSSGGRHHYRLTVGVVPVVTSAFPLAAPQAAERGRDQRREPAGSDQRALGPQSRAAESGSGDRAGARSRSGRRASKWPWASTARCASARATTPWRRHRP